MGSAVVCVYKCSSLVSHTSAVCICSSTRLQCVGVVYMDQAIDHFLQEYIEMMCLWVLVIRWLNICYTP